MFTVCSHMSKHKHNVHFTMEHISIIPTSQNDRTEHLGIIPTSRNVHTYTKY
jgi:hypothetical protein